MPFQSEKQRRYLWANEPEIARDWTDTYGSRIEKNDGGIMRVGLKRGGGHHSRGSRGPQGPGPGGQGARGQATHNPGTSQAPQGGHHGGGGGGGSKPPTRRTGPHTDTGGYVPTDVPEGIKRPTAPKDGIKNFFKKQLQSRVNTGYNWSMMLPGQRKRSLQYAQNFLNYRKNQGEDVSEFEEIFKMDPKNWGAKEFNLMNTLTGGTSSKLSNQNVPPGERVERELLNYGDYLSKYEGAPGLKYSGNVGNLEKFKKADGTYGYKEITGGEGPIYYPGYVPGGTPQGGGGGGGTTAATTTTTPSAFQESLTTSTSSPFDYYVGQDPTSANLAWGQQFGVDPRTMYRTSWAADGGRIGRAYGGIMDSSTGRRAYGLGSIFKSVKRAASKVLKSPIGKAALIGGLGYLATPGTFGMGSFNPAGKGAWWKNLMMGKLARAPGLPNQQMTRQGGLFSKLGGLFKGGGDYTSNQWNPWKIGIAAAGALPFFMGGEEEEEGDKFDYMGAKNAYADEIMRLRRGVMAGNLKDAATQSFLPVNYREGGRIGLQEGGDPLLREEYDKYVFEMKEMGLQPMSFEEFLAQARSGMYAGGQSTPSDYTMEDAMMTTTQDKLGGITDVMKQADLNRQGSVGQFYAAQGGRIGYDNGGGVASMREALKNKGYDWLDKADDRTVRQIFDSEMGTWTASDVWRPGKQEGGLMDLGGMEKDYRNDGGFVPIGGEEKADDVPARLSKNEFVFTADAVRGAGDGDIDKGAEIMENVMKNLEQGGQISEETQGLSGAQEMFGVSERLSEVV